MDRLTQLFLKYGGMVSYLFIVGVVPHVWTNFASGRYMSGSLGTWVFTPLHILLSGFICGLSASAGFHAVSLWEERFASSSFCKASFCHMPSKMIFPLVVFPNLITRGFSFTDVQVRIHSRSVLALHTGCGGTN